MSTLCRLELWSPGKQSWHITHHGVALLHPERYVTRLAERGIAGRCTELDDRLQPLGQVWDTPLDLAEAVEPHRHQPADPPSRSVAAPTATRPAPAAPKPVKTAQDPACDYCGNPHPQPHDGSCLL